MANFVVIRHKVRDFAEWKAGYDSHRSKRSEARLTEKQVMRSVGDPNEVVLFFEVADIARAQAFAKSADLRETMQKIGVVDQPDVYFLQN